MAARIKESLTIANSNAELDDDDPFRGEDEDAV